MLDNRVCRPFMLPNLSNLSTRKLPQPPPPSLDEGIHRLDDKSKPSFIYVKSAVRVEPQDVATFANFMIHNVASTPNPMNPSTNILRKQATFQPTTFKNYAFSGQTMQTVGGDPLDWARTTGSTILTTVLEDAQTRAEASGINKQLYNVVHANYYPDGKAGVALHKDDEDHIVAGMPIFSYTFLVGHKNARTFVIARAPILAEQESQRSDYDRKKAERAQKASISGAPTKLDKSKFKPVPIILYRIPLGDGDLVIMQGEMQKHYTHGLPAENRKEFANAPRINLTVRAFKPTEQSRVAWTGSVDRSHLTACVWY
jgi:alkylated DNA repair dioxygenase AlkB